MSLRAIVLKSSMPFTKRTTFAFRSLPRLPLTPSAQHFTRPLRAHRFYTSSSKAGKQQQQTLKINSLASSPKIIEAAKTTNTEPKTSKLKELTKKYGVVGVLVYLGVGCVDLGITFGVIQLAGLDKVKALEQGALDMVYNTGEKFGLKRKPVTAQVNEPSDLSEINGDMVKVEDDTPSLASVFILAYGIHKTLLLPVRLTITAAITPAIVRKLHQMGWARYFPRLLGATSTPKKL
ncbi:hypothetical protein CU098_005079 [Rhizopus stolonifer]|uniref:DUF1279 domain-containing protein n=1 Tax=Rhizopus stolonifer TaxID=4846 RepID=A0A367IRC9_RHIST|nr:hypothetical protein CU098_005079 [Rhizopus stolonifer]